MYIYFQTSSGGDKSFFEIIVKQVTEYNKESSMFDVVVSGLVLSSH